MARLLTFLCALYVLGGEVTQAKVLGKASDARSRLSGGCSSCDLDTMVKDCPLDVVFMLDMSDSVSPAVYRQARDYVARQMNVVYSAFQDTQIGFLAFSSIVHTDIPIQSRTQFELQQLITQVQNLPQERYETQLADAFRRAREALNAHTGYTLVPGGKRGKLIVLLSDGCLDDNSAVKKEAAQAKLDGIAIISVQLGSEVFLELLKAISVSVLELGQDINWGNTVACPHTFLPPVNKTACGDFVIAMDGSDSVRRWEKVMRDYLAFTAIRYSNHNNAMGVIVFGTNVTSQSADTMIRPSRNKWELADQIENTLAFPHRRGTGTTQAIRKATAFLRELAQPAPSPSPSNFRSLIVITDGPALNPLNARQALAEAKSEGFQVIIIGVGDVLTFAELQMMAGQDSTILQVDSYLTLFSIDLSNYICVGGHSGGCTTICKPVQIQNPIDCSCSCRTTCPSGARQDPNTCNCTFCPNNIQCGLYQQFNPNTCTCEPKCHNISCSGNWVLNPDTCQCVCPSNVQCGFGYQLNYTNCTCVPICPNSCSGNWVLNPFNCQCVCPSNFQCGSGYQINYTNCTCDKICTTTCPGNYVLNTNNCQCEPKCPNKSCSGNWVLNFDTCQCVCPSNFQCGFGQQLNYASCTCECPRVYCNYPQVLNNATCGCECPQRYCNYPQVLNNATCGCECPRVYCNYPQVLNNATCGCEPKCSNTCFGNWVLNPETCQCECPQRFCSSPKVLNRATCDCECPQPFCSSPKVLNSATCDCVCPPNIQCGLNQQLNPNTCTCECRQSYCHPPQVLNNATCGCECQRYCNFPKVLNSATCDCECPQRYCHPPQVLNNATCGCECLPRYCTPPQVFNSATCACECPQVSCNYPQVLNNATCGCVCSPNIQCGLYQQFNPNTCTCVCPNTFQCPPGQRPNYDRCTCESGGCPNTCPVNFDINLNTCQCECRKPLYCGQDQRPDYSKCSCEPKCPNKSCSGNWVLNFDTCQCVCPNTVQCGFGKQLNYTSCTCECPLSYCNFPQAFNIATCLCECPQRSCNPPKVLNATCGCECPQRYCTPPQVLNSATCACVQDPCLRTCSGNFVLDSKCQCVCPNTVQCGLNQRLNPNTCTCEDAGTTTTCSAAQHRCQNNQPAVEDCQGRCICQCNPQLYAGFYCDLPIKASLCDNCTFINGHYLAGVHGRCDMYVMCQPDGSGGYIPHINHCPPGTVFKEDKKMGTAVCNFPTSAGTCPTDPCQTLGPYAKYPHSRFCGKYWQCDAHSKTSSVECCPAGQAFDGSRGICVSDRNCPNDCDANFKSCGDPYTGGGDNTTTAPQCPYITKPGDPNKFVNPLAPTLYQSCAPSDIFDVKLCRCVQGTTPDGRPVCKPYYDISFDNLDDMHNGFHNVEVHPGTPLGGHGDVGYFKGSSRIILYRFSGSGYYTDYFEISLRLRLEALNLVGSQQMAIVSNGDCGGQETLAITIDKNKVYFKVNSSEGTYTVLEVNYNFIANGWLDIKLQYERKEQSSYYLMTGTVNGQSNSVSVHGVIGQTQCALQVGHGAGSANLTGYVDDFLVWKCKPNGYTGVSNNGGSSNSGSWNTQNSGSWNTQNSGSWNTQNSGSWNTQIGGIWNNQISGPVSSGQVTWSSGSKKSN